MGSSKTKYMGFKEIAAYSLGLFGFQAIVGLLNSYQAEFDASILGADIAVVGILVLVAKILSAVFDPFVGNMIDRSKSKKGKFKSMIAKSILPLLVMTSAVFIDVPFKTNKVAVYIWIFVTFLLWSFAMTLGDVPSQGIASVLTPDPTERTNVVSISNTFKQIGFSACVVIVPIACLIIPGGSKVLVKSGETDLPMIANEYLFTAVLTAVLGCVLFMLIPLINKERVPYSAGEKISFKDMLNALKSNKPFMLVIISYFLGFGRQMAMGIQVQAANILLGSQNLVAVLGISTAIGTMISMAACPFLIKKLDEKKVFIGLSVYGFIASVFSFVIAHFWFINPGNTVLTVLFYFSLFLLGLQFASVNLMPMIMTADCVDYYEYETGKRMETNCNQVMVCYNVVNPAFSPEGTCVMSLTSTFMADVWADVEQDDYVKTKTDFAEKLIRLFEERTGITVTPYIEEIEIATPWTMCNYVNTPEGSAYGFELKDWDNMMPRMMMMGTEFPVKGLKFVGAASIRGDGYNSAIFSGDTLAKKTLAEMKAEEA